MAAEKDIPDDAERFVEQGLDPAFVTLTDADGAAIDASEERREENDE